MPRNPNSPHNNCGPIHTHISASENIKLQVMMAKLEDELKNELKSIDRIEKTATDGLIDTYTIYFTNDFEPYTFTVTNGDKGEKGDKGDKGDTGEVGPQGPQGEKGERGTGINIKANREDCQTLGDAYIDNDTESEFYGHIFLLTSLDPLTFENGGEIKGPKGDKGDAFTYDDFTQDQLESLRGPQGLKGEKGDQGETGAAFTYDMFTPEQLEALKVKGDKGEKGDAFTYNDFTEEQLRALKGEQGIRGEKGEDGQDGLTTVIKVGETIYEHDNGTITLPEFLTEHQSLEDYAKKTELFSKDYNDLTNKPAIPSIDGLASTKYVDNAIASIEYPTVDLTSLATKQELQEAIEDIVIPEPTDLSNYYNKTEVDTKLENIKHPTVDLTAYAKKDELFSKDYNDLTNKPELFSGSYNDLTEKPQLFSGNYNDLSNKPEIPVLPTSVSAFANDAGYLTQHQDISHLATKEELPSLEGYAKTSELFSGSYEDLTNKPEIPNIAGLASEKFVVEEINKIEIPEAYNDSELRTLINLKAASEHSHEEYALVEHTHDGYLTEHQSLAEYAKKTDLFSKSYNDLTDKPTIPNIEGLATEEFVNKKIAEAELADKEADLEAYYTKSEVDNLIEGIELKEGPAGADGKDGASPEIIDGYWYINGEPTGVKAEGTDGAKGVDGTPGEKGDKGDAFTYDDFTEEQLAALKGEKGNTGEQGPVGPQGIQGIQGEKGDKGEPGKDGLTTAIKIGETTYVHENGIITLPQSTNSTHTHDGEALYPSTITMWDENAEFILGPSDNVLIQPGYLRISGDNSGSGTIELDTTTNKFTINGSAIATEGYINNAVAKPVEDVKSTLDIKVLPAVSKVEEIEPTVSELKTWIQEKEYLQDIDLDGYAKLIDLQIGEDFTTDITVGRLQAGTEIKSTMTFGELLKKILRCEHDYGDWVITKQPGVGIPGEQQKTCKLCGDVITEEIPALPQPDEPTEGLKYLAGTFGNTDNLQEWPEPFIADWSEEEQEEISMHYVNNMIEYSAASEDDLVGRHGFAITTPFVKESNSLAAYGEISEDPYITRPAIVLPVGYEVTAWNTDIDNSSLSECTVYKYDLVDGRTVYYAGGFTQQTGTTITHYLTIVKN